jgi:signal transduction histidine kinase
MKHQRNNIVMEVSDNGMGIAEKSISKIFDMFYRGTSSSIGTGLGLYITKEILNKLGGRISVESKLNEGTKMIITLPIINNKL